MEEQSQEVSKQKVKETFKQIYEVKQQVSDLNKAISELKKNLAKVLKAKPASVNQAYSEWEARIKKKDVMDEKDEILVQYFDL